MDLDWTDKYIKTLVPYRLHTVVGNNNTNAYIVCYIHLYVIIIIIGNVDLNLNNIISDVL